MISTHILDTTLGSPAGNVVVRLERETKGAWTQLAQQPTNTDGRATFDVPAEAGRYRLTFDIEAYFSQQKREHFFLNPSVGFHITNTARKYHVPLLLNPYGHSTYRGS